MPDGVDVRAYIGLGSNLRGPRGQVQRAFARLRTMPGVSDCRTSSLYATPPWGDVHQAPFVNAVAEITTTLRARALLLRLLALERASGRARSGRRWGPRIIDLDLLVFGRERRSEPGLTLPHPRISERAFVLVPLYELAPDLAIPGLPPLGQLLDACPDAERVERMTL